MNIFFIKGKEVSKEVYIAYMAKQAYKHCIYCKDKECNRTKEDGGCICHNTLRI